jgi:hypothetical protein
MFPQMKTDYVVLDVLLLVSNVEQTASTVAAEVPPVLAIATTI